MRGCETRSRAGMARHDAGWWAERVAELERTGDAERIARRDRVTVKLLKWWRWRLRSEPAKVAPDARQTAQARRGEQRLLPVVLATEPEMHAPADDEPEAATVIETSHGRISIRGTLSAEQLAAVVAELVRGC